MTTILAVDDSTTMRACLEMTFSGTEFDLITCEGATAFLDELVAQSPALVIIDASLPSTDSYDLADAVRAAAPEVRILLLNSRQHPFDALRATAVDGTFDKPFETQALLDAVKAILDTPIESDIAITRGAEAARLPSTLGTTLPGLAPVEVPDLGQTLDYAAAGGSPLAGSTNSASAAGEPEEALREPARRPDSEESELDEAELEFSESELDEPLPEPPTMPASEELPTPPAVPSPRLRGMTQAWDIPAELVERSARLTGFNEAAPAGDAVESVEAPLAEPPPRAREVTATWEAADSGEVAGGVREVAVSEAELAAKFEGLGLSPKQLEEVVAITRETIERVAWEVVPTLAETIIREELRRLTQD